MSSIIVGTYIRSITRKYLAWLHFYQCVLQMMSNWIFCWRVEYPSSYFTASDFSQQPQNHTIPSVLSPRDRVVVRATLPVVDDDIDEEDVEGFVALLEILDIAEGVIINGTGRMVTLIRIFDDDGEKQIFISGVSELSGWNTWWCRESTLDVKF